MRTQHPSKSDPSELSSKERQKLYERLRAVLDERLRLAVTSCNSYGLDEGVGAAEGIRSSLTGLNSDGSLPGISMLPAQAERQLAPMTESYAMDHGAALSTSSSRSIDSEPEAEQIMPLREKDWGAQRSLHMPTNGTGNILAGPSSSMPSIRSEGGGEKNVPAFLGGLLEEPSEISVWANLNTPKSQSAGHKEELHPVKPGPRGFLPAFNASMPNHLRGPKNYQGSGDADTMELDVGGRNNRPGPDRIMMPASHGRGGTSSKPAAGRNNFLGKRPLEAPALVLCPAEGPAISAAGGASVFASSSVTLNGRPCAAEAGLPGMANEALVSPSAYRRPDRWVAHPHV